MHPSPCFSLALKTHPQLTNLLGHALQLGLAAAHQRHLEALGRELARKLGADAVRCTRDECAGSLAAEPAQRDAAGEEEGVESEEEGEERPEQSEGADDDEERLQQRSILCRGERLARRADGEGGHYVRRRAMLGDWRVGCGGEKSGSRLLSAARTDGPSVRGARRRQLGSGPRRA
jgi:hypothetical protein